MTSFDSATQLIEKLKTREVSALELLDEYLARIDRIDPDTNAICWLDAESARERATSLTDPPDEKRPLLGIPMTVKEAYDLAGSPTTWGVEDFADNIASTDSVGSATIECGRRRHLRQNQCVDHAGRHSEL